MIVKGLNSYDYEETITFLEKFDLHFSRHYNCEDGPSTSRPNSKKTDLLTIIEVQVQLPTIIPQFPDSHLLEALHQTN